MSISVQQLTKVYGSQRAIDEISFDVKTGEILGFLGPNGAGKTTTMKIITCFMPPSSGTVSLNQYNIHDHPVEIRRSIGYLPEHNPLYLDMYVKEYLEFVGRMYKLDHVLRRQRIGEIIEMTGLEREAHKKIGMLSKGYRQRVGLAQSLIHDPEVLILDEPTTGLDPNQIVEIRNLIRNVGKDKTVIFSSHILSEVEAIADRVIIINQGQIVANEMVSNVRSSATGHAVVQVGFEQPGFDTSNLINQKGVSYVQWSDDKTIRIYTEPDLDVRRDLFLECVEQNQIILSLNKEDYTLEDAFRDLTKDPESDR